MKPAAKTKAMKTEILKHETAAGNYLLVRAIDEADAEIAAQEFLDDLPDNDKYVYEAKAAVLTDEEGVYNVRYNVLDRPSALERATKHFLDLYADEKESITPDTIHEWWGMTEEQYDGVDYEELKEKILSQL
jgi:hypothetical protein